MDLGEHDEEDRCARRMSEGKEKKEEQGRREIQKLRNDSSASRFYT